MLDSYLSDELRFETNHAVMRHAEHCGACCSEMAARCNLRSALCDAVKTTTETPEFRHRLRKRLRAEAFATAGVPPIAPISPRASWFLK